jgi:hypothetical protein
MKYFLEEYCTSSHSSLSFMNSQNQEITLQRDKTGVVNSQKE